jgi:hypothetical protein
MLTDFEKKLIEEIDIKDAWSHVEYLSTLDKTSGTEGECLAHEYIREKLSHYGVPYSTYEFSSLISHPIESTLQIVEPVSKNIESRPAAFGANVLRNGVQGELVFVELPEGTLFGGIDGLIEVYKKANVEGKISIVWGLAAPTVMLAAQKAGALAQVHIGGEEVIHEMIVTTIWGTPTPESIQRMPKIPAISIKRSDGEKILTNLENGKVHVKLTSNVETKWRKIPVTVAHIEGENSDSFMLVHGHMDSWFYGTTDNCTGNAACLELSRLLAKSQKKLKRGVRIAWWSGHSTGRYSSSTWYADNFYEDLYKNCFVSMNIDSPGVLGATHVAGGGLMGTKETVGKVIKDVLGLQDITVHSRHSRAGDQSFYGIGIPSVSIHGRIPKDSPHAGEWIGGSGGAWWWHSPEDTIDKGDKNNLHRDLKIESVTITRLVNSEVLPFDFNEPVKTLEDSVDNYMIKNPEVDKLLQSTKEKITILKEHVSKMHNRLEKPIQDTCLKKVNKNLDKTSKTLTSLLYTYSGKYDQDPAYHMGIVPLLGPINKFTNASEKEKGYWKTRIVRNRNKVNDEIDALLENIKKIQQITKQ